MPRTLCKFFQRGNCRNGEQCRYLHINSSPNASYARSVPVNQTNNFNPMQQVQQYPNPSTTVVQENWVNAAEFVPNSNGQTDYSQSAPQLSRLKIRCCCKHISKVIKAARGIDTNENESDDDGEMQCEIEKMCYRPNINLNNMSTSSNIPRNQVPQASAAPPTLQEPDEEALNRSREQTCGICYEIVMEKPEREKRFGILPNCNHSFCLTCIRKWRQARQFENKIIRACPECRVTSDFVCPSSVWVDATCGKDKLLTDYKQALSQKPCKHFKQGRAKCPFGNKCFYLHALPDGTKADVGPPVRRSRNREMDIDMVQRYVIWNYVREREQERLLRNSRLDYVSEMDNVDDDDWFTVY